MDIHPVQYKVSRRLTKAFNVHYLQNSIFVDQGSGCCICPTCSHLVFDESLTGVCPNCHHRFAPSLPFRKRKDYRNRFRK